MNGLAVLPDCDFEVAALLEEDPQVGNPPFLQRGNVEIGVRHQGAYPVDQFAGGRLFSLPPEARGVCKRIDTDAGHRLAELREMDAHDPTHHLMVGKSDMVEVAAAQEGVREVFFAFDVIIITGRCLAETVLSTSMMSNCIWSSTSNISS